MELGIHMPTSGPLATPDNLVALAQRAERLGFSIITAGDHIVVPRRIESPYPYSRIHRPRTEHRWLDQMTALAFLAAHTTKVRLLTSVMVVPYRHPLMAAKALATIDVLSGGRLIVGCGIGWMEEEFQLLGLPPFRHRGTVSNDYIRAIKELWTSDNPTFEGSYVRFSDVWFDPRPVQKPHPPIWIAGESPAALKRAGRLGDGWEPVVNHPEFPLDTPEQVARSLAEVQRYAREAGRDPSRIEVAYEAEWNSKQARILPDGNRRAFTGNREQIRSDVVAFDQIGVRYAIFTLPHTSPETCVERMEAIAEFAGS